MPFQVKQSVKCQASSHNSLAITIALKCQFSAIYFTHHLYIAWPKLPQILGCFLKYPPLLCTCVCALEIAITSQRFFFFFSIMAAAAARVPSLITAMVC